VYDGTWSRHRQRVHGRSPAGLFGHRFVVCTQNHDQVGNRAVGERPSALMSEGRLKIAAALLLTSPFVPMLFQGEEWGAKTPFQYFTDHQDPALGEAVSRGRRQEFFAFGWNPDEVPDPQSPSTFERSKLDWTELDAAAHASMLAWYRSLIALRRATPALTDGRMDRFQIRSDSERGSLVLERGLVSVAVNLGAAECELRLDGSPDLLLSSAPAVRYCAGCVELPPDSVAIFVRRD
jgi:maltooligosyltrehalose trehalohydrolase